MWTPDNQPIQKCLYFVAIRNGWGTQERIFLHEKVKKVDLEYCLQLSCWSKYTTQPS